MKPDYRLVHASGAHFALKSEAQSGNCLLVFDLNTGMQQAFLCLPKSSGMCSFDWIRSEYLQTQDTSPLRIRHSQWSPSRSFPFRLEQITSLDILTSQVLTLSTLENESRQTPMIWPAPGNLLVLCLHKERGRGMKLQVTNLTTGDVVHWWTIQADDEHFYMDSGALCLVWSFYLVENCCCMDYLTPKSCM